MSDDDDIGLLSYVHYSTGCTIPIVITEDKEREKKVHPLSAHIAGERKKQ